MSIQSIRRSSVTIKPSQNRPHFLYSGKFQRIKSGITIPIVSTGLNLVKGARMLEVSIRDLTSRGSNSPLLGHTTALAGVSAVIGVLRVRKLCKGFRGIALKEKLEKFGRMVTIVATIGLSIITFSNFLIAVKAIRRICWINPFSKFLLVVSSLDIAFSIKEMVCAHRHLRQFRSAGDLKKKNFGLEEYRKFKVFILEDQAKAKAKKEQSLTDHYFLVGKDVINGRLEEIDADAEAKLAEADKLIESGETERGQKLIEETHTQLKETVKFFEKRLVTTRLSKALGTVSSAISIIISVLMITAPLFTPILLGASSLLVLAEVGKRWAYDATLEKQFKKALKLEKPL